MSKYRLKWGKYTQPPSIYWRLKHLEAQMRGNDPRLVASRMGPLSTVSLRNGEAITLSRILNDPKTLTDVLSNACMEVFGGKKEQRAIARDFDYLANGEDFQSKSKNVGTLIQTIVGDKLPSDATDSTTEQSTLTTNSIIG